MNSEDSRYYWRPAGTQSAPPTRQDRPLARWAQQSWDWWFLCVGVEGAEGWAWEGREGFCLESGFSFWKIMKLWSTELLKGLLGSKMSPFILQAAQSKCAQMVRTSFWALKGHQVRSHHSSPNSVDSVSGKDQRGFSGWVGCVTPVVSLIHPEEEETRSWNMQRIQLSCPQLA